MKHALFNSVKWIYAYSFFFAIAIFLMVASGCGNSNSQSEFEEADPVLVKEEGTGQPQGINTLTEEEKKDGWKLLFDGTATNEWTGTKGKGFPEKGWIIEDGILTVLGSHGTDHVSGGDIITKDQYGNFELSLEFKILRGANSGIKYFVVNDFPDHKGKYLGLEYQIIDDENHADAKLGVGGNRTIASLYDMIPAKNKTAKPVGEWNHARIIVNGSHVEHWLNGSQVVAYERGSDEFRKLVKASKYKNLQGFGEMPAGHILLQGHGDTVHYRNIKIRNLTGS
jgi:hypothetical protein